MTVVNEGSHSFTCHPHVYPQVEWTILAFTPQPQIVTALWPVLIFRPAEGRLVSWPEWLVTNRGNVPARSQAVTSTKVISSYHSLTMYKHREP